MAMKQGSAVRTFNVTFSYNYTGNYDFNDVWKTRSIKETFFTLKDHHRKFAKFLDRETGKQGHNTGKKTHFS